ncbi:unnamed protein product [Moneuplotes crassus]|uniref:FTH domain-containing protein n=1 Tax=Euplotes crassus TaxID=5936 RepID=A0AAD2D2H5_EUPCR|nr:unnamed protein product [Moneuplotes crassus]
MESDLEALEQVEEDERGTLGAHNQLQNLAQCQISPDYNTGYSLIIQNKIRRSKISLNYQTVRMGKMIKLNFPSNRAVVLNLFVFNTRVSKANTICLLKELAPIDFFELKVRYKGSSLRPNTDLLLKTILGIGFKVVKNLTLHNFKISQKQISQIFSSADRCERIEFDRCLFLPITRVYLFSNAGNKVELEELEFKTCRALNQSSEFFFNDIFAQILQVISNTMIKSTLKFVKIYQVVHKEEVLAMVRTLGLDDLLIEFELEYEDGGS